MYEKKDPPTVVETAVELIPSPHGAQGDPATPSSAGSGGIKQGDGTSLDAAKAREERKALRRKKRQGQLMDVMLDLQESAARDVALKKYVFLEKEELEAKGLTPQQIKKVRAWENPKKQVAYALEASAQHVTSMLRRDNDKAKVSINVETMNVIRLPEPEAETAVPVVVEIVPESK